MAQTIQAIAFDAYGTLFDVHSVASLAEQTFPGRGGELSLLWRQKQLEYTWLRTMSDRYRPFGEITRDALRHAASRLGLALKKGDEDRLMNQYSSLSAFPENVGALRSLRELGLPLAVLTNGDRRMIEISLKSAGMHALFDQILSAESVRRYKTQAEVYALAPAAFGCSPGEILFVSSNCWDAIAATWFGFDTFWVNRAGAPLEELGIEPRTTGHLLTDVVEYVRTRHPRRRARGRQPTKQPIPGEHR